MSDIANQGRKRKTSPSRLSESSSDDESQQIRPPPQVAPKVQKTSWDSDVKDRNNRNDNYQRRGNDRDNRGGDRQQNQRDHHHEAPNYNNRYPRNDRNNRDSGYYQHQGQGSSRGHQNQYHDRQRQSSGGSFYSDSYNQNQHQQRYGDRNRDSGNNSRASTYSGEGEGLAPVVARHYNEIKEKGLEAREESKIVILRKYNNWAKSMNFNDAMEGLREAGKGNYSLIGLDLCCGKGGDLRKWEKSQMMKHVVFVDIAEVSLNNCRERYEDMKKKHDEQREKRGGRMAPLFTAEFFVADCTRESVSSKMSDPAMTFDVVSCQFSFHYCFESPTQARQMINNATEKLVPGGYFIGTLPNADRIVKRRRQRKEAEFGNEVYKIRFECEEPYPVYGARYFFELEDAISCPEFLVHFPTFKKLAADAGLELIYRHTFDKFHKRHEQNPDAKRLLSGMGALETFPPNQGEALHFDESHYDHAQRYVREQREWEPDRQDIRVGTISRVEWEAITLYLAFCFRKKATE